MSDLLELESQAVVTFIWVLGTEPRFSERVANALHQLRCLSGLLVISLSLLTKWVNLEDLPLLETCSYYVALAGMELHM